MIDFLEKHGITPNELFVLELYQQHDFKDVAQICKNIGLPRVKIVMNLVKLGYLHIESYNAVNNPNITEKGEKVLDEINYRQNYEKPNISNEDVDIYFEDFWKTFPSWDNSILKNYSKTRNLKSDKQGCKKIYSKLLNTYSHSDIMKGLHNEIAFRKNTSNAGDNKFIYMKNSKTWLSQKEFENYLEYDDTRPKGYSTGI